MQNARLRQQIHANCGHVAHVALIPLYNDARSTPSTSIVFFSEIGSLSPVAASHDVLMEKPGSCTTGLGLWLQRELSEGAVMVDVGANVGDYTALAARVVGLSGHVHAFEPAPENVARLRERFDALSHVSVVAAAVGDRRGTTTFFLDRRESTRHSCAAANVGKAGTSITVPQVALDDYYARMSRLDVVKIDAQGAELSILRGAGRLLTRFRPAMVLEPRATKTNEWRKAFMSPS